MVSGTGKNGSGKVGKRNFNGFRAAADEAAASRIYAGIHYRFASDGGKPQGQCVVDKVLALKFKP
jgi:hypothetical protein